MSMSAERRKELIKSIRPNAANFDYISKSPNQTINGSLMQDIDKIMEQYTNERLQECYRQKRNLEEQLAALTPPAITPSFKDA
jgi:hypothetical protein